MAWLSLDAATPASGCLEVIRGSHLRGVCTAEIFADEATVESFDERERLHLPAEPGELILLHNLLLHRSAANSQDQVRACCHRLPAPLLRGA